MALTPEKQAKLQAVATVASGLAISPQWWFAFWARRKRTGAEYPQALVDDAWDITERLIEKIDP